MGDLERLPGGRLGSRVAAEARLAHERAQQPGASRRVEIFVAQQPVEQRDPRFVDDAVRTVRPRGRHVPRGEDVDEQVVGARRLRSLDGRGQDRPRGVGAAGVQHRPHLPAQQLDAGRGVRRRREIQAAQRLPVEISRGVVGVARLGELRCPHRVGGGRRTVGRGGRLSGVVGERGQVRGVQLGHRIGDPGVPAPAPQGGDAGVERLPHEQVREAHGAGRGLHQQPADHTGLERVQHGVLVDLGGADQQLGVDVAADHRRDPQRRDGLLRQPPEAAAQDVGHAFGYLRGRDESALAGQQPRALDDVEGIPVGAFGEGVDDQVVRRRPEHAADHLGDRRAIETVEPHPGRAVPGQRAEQVVEEWRAFGR